MRVFGTIDAALSPIRLFTRLDFYDVTHVWVKHWWNVPSMAWFRENYCEPGTAGSLCMVPQCGEFQIDCNELAWCIDNYAATNCTDIRNMAQLEVEELMNIYYNSNLAWGFVLIMIVRPAPLI
jgi:hypothetical protein